MKQFTPSKSYIRVAIGTPLIQLGNIEANRDAIASLYNKASKNNTSLVVFPELCITGYSIGDLLQSSSLLNRTEDALMHLASLTNDANSAMIVGLPLRMNNALYNCSAFLADGEVKGIVPKMNLPTYKEFYEKRWFQIWDEQPTTTKIGNQVIPFGSVLFALDGVNIGIEICEDVWVARPPSESLIARGAQIICNPSASPEMVTKADYRRQLIANTSARLVCGYIYAGADPSESTMDTVMSGHGLIYQMGRLLAERPPFSSDEQRLLEADIDIDHIINDRLHDNNFPNDAMSEPITTTIKRSQNDMRQNIDSSPFTPKGSSQEISSRLEEILAIQSYGLKKRLESSGAQKVVLGLSGGLDSTLSLLVAVRTAKIRNMNPQDMILTLTMPGEASSKRTQNNAQKLAIALGVENRVIVIGQLVNDQLLAMSHSNHNQDITYENTQARMRTSLLFNTANTEKAIVLGTGDLSELALGWCTFNGDHMSAYNVNGSVPKTLVKYLVRHEAVLQAKLAQQILLDILDTPISPELTKAKGNSISQKTEDLVGPYELHDFFLFHFIRWMESPEKILYLANVAFKDSYSPALVKQWLNVFLKRFTTNQWKRSVMPDGPKVGSVSLSPRGDWRMPSDIDASTFTSQLV